MRVTVREIDVRVTARERERGEGDSKGGRPSGPRGGCGRAAPTPRAGPPSRPAVAPASTKRDW